MVSFFKGGLDKGVLMYNTFQADFILAQEVPRASDVLRLITQGIFQTEKILKYVSLPLAQHVA